VKEILTRCGYRCDLCLAYKVNVESEDRREELSDGWFQIYGFRIPAEEIVCDGCMSGENPVLIDRNCPVRSCVISRNLPNCAACGDYQCENLKGRIVSRDAQEEKLGRKLTESEYMLFVQPYESGPRLDSLR